MMGARVREVGTVANLPEKRAALAIEARKLGGRMADARCVQTFAAEIVVVIRVVYTALAPWPPGHE